MTAARPSDANLRRAAALAKAHGVTVEVEANGTIFRIAPPRDSVPTSGGNPCDEAFGADAPLARAGARR